MTRPRPRHWPRRRSTTRTIIGIVGPAFSGESKAADPAFNEAGLATITPSATNPALAKNGWKTFFRALGNDATQGPAAAKYIKEDLKATKVFVIDDASEYGKGLADIVKSDLGPMVIGTDRVPAEADRLLRLRHQGQGLRRATRSSTVATTPRPACWSSS